MKYFILKANHKFFIGMKNWLFSDLKQSIYLADHEDLLEYLNFNDFKADHPQANLFYGSYFKTLTKLCFNPSSYNYGRFAISIGLGIES